jgi:hypothetical protein
MARFHFISYSAVDGFDLALRLCDELQIGPPSLETWLDKRRLQANADWDRQIVQAIRDCESLIFDDARQRGGCFGLQERVGAGAALQETERSGAAAPGCQNPVPVELTPAHQCCRIVRASLSRIALA